MSDESKRLPLTPPPGLLPPPKTASERAPVNTGSETRRLPTSRGMPAFYSRVPGAPPAAGIGATVDAPPAPRRWFARLAGGAETVITAAGLVLGRNPVAPEGWPEAELLAVVDPAKSVSKTHALFVADDSGVRVFDLASTNGSAVSVDGSAREPVGRGGCHVPERGTVELGSYALVIVRS